MPLGGTCNQTCWLAEACQSSSSSSQRKGPKIQFCLLLTEAKTHSTQTKQLFCAWHGLTACPAQTFVAYMLAFWAAWYITRLLIKLTPRGVVFSFLSILSCLVLTSGGTYSGSDLSLKSPMFCSASRMACRSAGDSKESSGRVALKATSSASLFFLASRLQCMNTDISNVLYAAVKMRHYTLFKSMSTATLLVSCP